MTGDVHQVFHPAPDAPAYQPMPTSAYRVKLAFRVDFTNGGYVYGKDFLLDIPGAEVSPGRAAEMVVSAMHLLRAGPVTLFSMQVVERGTHQDG